MYPINSPLSDLEQENARIEIASIKNIFFTYFLIFSKVRIRKNNIILDAKINFWFNYTKFLFKHSNILSEII